MGIALYLEGHGFLLGCGSDADALGDSSDSRLISHLYDPVDVVVAVILHHQSGKTGGRSDDRFENQGSVVFEIDFDDLRGSPAIDSVDFKVLQELGREGRRDFGKDSKVCLEETEAYLTDPNLREHLRLLSVWRREKRRRGQRSPNPPPRATGARVR
jgi:hypothetical protein